MICKALHPSLCLRISAVREELRTIDFFEVYVGLVGALLSAMAAQAPAGKS